MCACLSAIAARDEEISLYRTVSYVTQLVTVY